MRTILTEDASLIFDDGVEAYTIEGFDTECNWNPTIIKCSDGEINILFPEFPPDIVANSGDYDDFDKILEKVTGAKICWQDRELFSIEKPQADTMDKLKEFFLNYKA